MPKVSPLEQSFIDHWRLLARDLPTYEVEYRFHPERKWRVDFAWPVQGVAVEIEGAVYAQGRHTRGSGFVADMDKYNALSLAGFRLLRFHGGMLEENPKGCIDMVRALLAQVPQTQYTSRSETTSGGTEK